jgi:regulatory protein
MENGDLLPAQDAKITAIEQGRRPGRFNVYVNGVFAAASGEKTIAELHLRVGAVFTAERLAEITQSEERRRALEAAARLLETRMRSASEIAQRLRLKGYEDDTIADVTETLKRLNLLDDTQFASQWVESRSRAQPKGGRALRVELAQKGVARETIDEAVSEITPDAEVDLARRALQSRMARVAKATDLDVRMAERRRLTAFLQRRGFGWDAVKKALDTEFGRVEEGEEPGD